MILGIAGRAGAGKDTIADILVRERGFVKVSLADPLKRICRDVFDLSEHQLWGPSENRNALDMRFTRLVEHPCGNGSDAYTERVPGLSPRHALQTLGTEWGRQCDANVWIDYAIRIAEPLKRGNHEYSQMLGLRYCGAAPGRDIVIPDVRFENEATAIERAGGRVIVVTREDGARLEGAAAAHVSERGWQAIATRERAWCITNDGTKDELVSRVLRDYDLGVFS